MIHHCTLCGVLDECDNKGNDMSAKNPKHKYRETVGAHQPGPTKCLVCGVQTRMVQGRKSWRQQWFVDGKWTSNRPPCA